MNRSITNRIAKLEQKQETIEDRSCPVVLCGTAEELERQKANYPEGTNFLCVRFVASDGNGRLAAHESVFPV